MVKHNKQHSKKDLALWAACLRYFEGAPAMWHRLSLIVGGKEKPSLRLIFFYVTSYLKNHPFVLPGSRLKTMQDAHAHYRHMLGVHTKKRFDPFCRRQRFDVELHGTQISTNVGQLVFFRWFFEMGLYDKLMACHDDVLRTRACQKKRATPVCPRSRTSDPSRLVLRVDTNDNRGPTIRIAVRFD